MAHARHLERLKGLLSAGAGTVAVIYTQAVPGLVRLFNADTREDWPAASEATLQLYSVNAITKGTDSQGEVTVRLEKGGRIVNGNGADTDILVASAKAYINALNLMQAGQKAHPQVADV